MSHLSEFPYTYESDYSTYDATNNKCFRDAWDVTLFSCIDKAGLIGDVWDSLNPENRGKKGFKTDDKKRVAKTETEFTSKITVRGLKTCKVKKTKTCTVSNETMLMFCKGILVGTTYSGDPSATSNCGTGRNLSYHLFGIWKARDRFKMAPVL